jgi:UDPglucose 6-dehydrogenase
VKIVIVGTGYVGLVTGTCFAESGHQVACVDVDQQKIATLRAGGIPIYEPGLEELVRRNAREGRLSFTTSLEEAMQGAEVAFIAVGTPPGETGEADLSHVLVAAEQIGRAIRRYTVVVNKSTVPVGSAEKVAEAIRRANPGADFDVVSNPEFLKEGAAIDDFMKPDRVVVGTSSERARAVMAELHAPFVRVEQPILFMDTRSAELTKYAANAMLATRISFMNDVAALCERLGADVDHVRRGLGSDKRVGHPFLFPGVGFGGSCLAGGETVLVRQDGRARLVELGALFDALSVAAEGAVPAAAALRPEGLEALAWRPGSARAEFLPVAFVTRRPFEGEAVEVRTKMGRRLLCTPDHPFVVTSKTGERFRMKAAQDLGSDDWLPVALGSEVSAPATAPRALDLLQAVEAADLDAANVIMHPAMEEMWRLAASGPAGVSAAIAPLRHPRGRERVSDILRTGSLRLDEVAVAGVSLSGARASTVKNGTRVPATIAADAAFWRMVGLYLAEGHCSVDGARRRLVWSFHPTREQSLVEEVASYWHELGVKADVRHTPTSMRVSVSSRLLASFFLDVLEVGGDCYSHRIPDLIWSEPDAHRWALLSGLWHGDGSWSLVNGGPSVVLEWGSASRPLADGLLRLLATVSIVASLRVGRTARSTVDSYWVRVAGADQVERCLDLVKPDERRGVRRSLARQKRRIAPTGYVRLGGAALVRVASVTSRALEGPVYSLEVPGAHTFVASGGLVVHNCFPKDLRAMIRIARDEGLDFDLLRSVERVNERQKRWLVEKALKHFGSFAGKTFGVWGLAFKPRTDDMREAPAIAVVEGLVGNGARVRAHDPVAAEVARRLFHDRIEIVAEPYAAAEGADALFLVTEWNEFRQPDLARLKRAMRTPVLFDGRNVWDAGKARAAGFAYHGVGRGNSDG